MMPHAVKKIINRIGVDGAIAFTLLTRLVQTGSALIIVLFIGRYLSAGEQGYYYTFSSILAIQVFFELGLSGILTQYTAHEFAHLKWGDNFELIGDDYFKSRVSSLLRFCVKWFLIISIVLFFILLIIGHYYFSAFNNNLHVQWQNPWVVLCIATALNLFIDPILAMFDGFGQVKDMAKLRLVQKAANLVFVIVLFLFGFKLYACALASLLAIVINYFQLLFSDRLKYLKTIWNSNGDATIDYYKEIFPFQWRIALSWVSGYFIFQLFNPVLFATDGAVVAGQMGMTLAALNGILSLSLSWINTKVPVFSALIARKDYRELDVIFNKNVFQSTMVTIVLLLLFITGVFCLRYFNIAIGHRFLGYLPLILLCVSTLVSQFVYSIATYLRCHKQEPFLVQSIVMGALTALSTLVLGRLFGVIGITLGYSVLTVFITLTWSVITFKNKRTLWHTV